jgi:trehalose-6-phosphate synthase
MPQEERRARHQAMMKTLESSSLAAWFSDFMAALNAAPPVRREIRQPERTVVPLPRRRPELAIVRTH